MRIVICDDHRLLSEALSVILEARGHHVLALTTQPSEAAAIAGKEHVDACVMDLGFPDADGVEGIRLLRLASPTTRIVVLSAEEDADRMEAAVAAGASAYVVKDAQPSQLVDVLERVAAGESQILPRLDATPSGSSSSTARVTHFLTARELEVLERLVRGQSTSAMAQEMGVAYSTIRTHIQNVLTKLGVHSKIAAVAYAVKHRLVPANGNRRPDTEKGTEREHQSAAG